MREGRDPEMRLIVLTAALSILAALGTNAAPEWFRDAEVYNGWYKAWDTKVVADKMAGIPLVIGAPADAKIVEAAHRQGTRVLTYITLYQMPLEEVYQDSKLADHPDWILVNAQGERSRSVFWGTENIGWYEVCDNNASYRKAALAYIRKILATGIDGLFIDNAHPPMQCYGAKLGKHKHIFAGEDHLRPWQDFMREVVRTVKDGHPDRIVILNPGEPSDFHRGLADGIMIESYICTHASNVRWHDWNKILQWAKGWGDGPDQIVALSYIGFTSAPPREDAFYCYACARLSGFLWADWYSKFDNYKDLFALRLGQPTGRMHQQGPVFYRSFEHGIVAVNPGSDSAELVLHVKGDSAIDQYKGDQIKLTDSTLRVEIPAGAGRVYKLPE